MTHTIHSPASDIEVQSGPVVSKVIHRDEHLDVTVFAFDAGEGLTEHQASSDAVVQGQSGQLHFIVDGEELDLTPGSWLHMAPGAPHSLTAAEPTIMMLTLIRA